MYPLTLSLFDDPLSQGREVTKLRSGGGVGFLSGRRGFEGCVFLFVVFVSATAAGWTFYGAFVRLPAPGCIACVGLDLNIFARCGPVCLCQ